VEERDERTYGQTFIGRLAYAARRDLVSDEWVGGTSELDETGIDIRIRIDARAQ
jgi:hypothetical protein